DAQTLDARPGPPIVEQPVESFEPSIHRSRARHQSYPVTLNPMMSVASSSSSAGARCRPVRADGVKPNCLQRITICFHASERILTFGLTTRLVAPALFVCSTVRPCSL